MKDMGVFNLSIGLNLQESKLEIKNLVENLIGIMATYQVITHLIKLLMKKVMELCEPFYQQRK